MKKSIIAISLILTLVLSLSSCFGGNIEDPAYSTLNELTSSLPATYVLETVVESNDGHSVTEKYTVSENGVLYRVERLNGFTANGDSYNAPDSYKTVSETLLTLDEQSKHNFSVPTFKFSSKSLSNPVTVGSVLNADIVSFEEFIGKNLDGKDAKLSVSYSATAINYILITYTTENGNNVSIKYSFE